MANKPTYKELDQRVRELEKEMIGRKRTEKTLRESEGKYRLLIETMNDGLCMVDIKGLIVYVNNQFCKMLGYTNDEVIGLQATDILDKENQKIFRDKFKGQKKGKAEPYELTLIGSGGRQVTTIISPKPITDSKNNVVGSFAVITDITERKQMEKELRASEEKFRKIFDNANIMIWGTSSDGKIKIFNKEAERVMGYSREEALGMMNMSLHPPEEREEILEKFKQHKEGVKKKDLELGVYTKEGKKLEVLLSQATFKDATGEDFYVALMQDITERKRAEDALRESDERYRSLVGNINLGVSLIDADYNLIMVNEVIGSFFKKDISEFIGKKCYRECEKRENICSYCPGTRAMATGTLQEVETEGVLDDGSSFIAWLRAFPTFGPEGEITGFIEVVEDITDRKRADDVLRKSEASLAKAQEIAHIGNWEWDIEADKITWSDEVYRIYGIDPQTKLTYDVLMESIHPDDRDYHNNMVADWIKNKGGDPYEYRVLRPDGSIRYVYAPGEIICDNAGKPIKMFGVVQDITDRKLAEMAQKESEEKYRAQFEDSLDGIVIADAKSGIIIDCNPAIQKLVRREKSELIGKHQLILHPHEEKDGEFSRTFKQHLIKYRGQALETQIITKDGKKRDVSIKANLLTVRGKNYLWGIFHDITDHKWAEKQIKQSLKEKDVLLKEVHHRVKNNLQVISSLLNIQARHTKDQQIQNMLKDSQNRIKSMALVHEKLYQSKDLSSILFDSYIKSLVRSLFRSLGGDSRKIAFKETMDNICLEVDQAIPCGLIITELVSNSFKHAFPDKRGGQIKISLSLTDEKEILLTVGDNGVGFPSNLDFRNTDTLGMQLVTSLVEEQLGGEIMLNKNNEFKIKFNIGK